MSLVLMTAAMVCRAACAGPLSGKSHPYVNQGAGYQLQIPDEFTINEENEGSTTLDGPDVGGQETELTILADRLNGKPEVYYSPNFQRTKTGGQFEDVVSVTLQGVPQALAYRYKTPKAIASKSGVSMWNLEVYVPGQHFHVELQGAYQAFEDGTLAKVFDGLIKSFSLPEAK
jgi:hypothetical protein